MFHFPTTATPAIKAIDAILSAIDVIDAKATQVLTYDNATALSFKAGVAINKASKAIYCAMYFAGCFFYYLGRACGEGHYNVKIAAAQLATEDLVGPDADLDAIVNNFFNFFNDPVLSEERYAADMAKIAQIPSYDGLNALPVKELRAMCSKADVTWRNANGPSKHLTKAQMIGELL